MMMMTMMVVVVMVTMIMIFKRLNMTYNRSLMIDDASMDVKFDDFAKRDRRTDRRTDRHTGFLGCD